MSPDGAALATVRGKRDTRRLALMPGRSGRPLFPPGLSDDWTAVLQRDDRARRHRVKAGRELAGQLRSNQPGDFVRGDEREPGTLGRRRNAVNCGHGSGGRSSPSSSATSRRHAACGRSQASLYTGSTSSTRPCSVAEKRGRGHPLAGQRRRILVRRREGCRLMPVTPRVYRHREPGRFPVPEVTLGMQGVTIGGVMGRALEPGGERPGQVVRRARCAAGLPSPSWATGPATRLLRCRGTSGVSRR